MTAAFWVSYVLLWILVVVLGVAVFALYHHFGQMYLGSPGGRAGQGPKEGSYFKPVETVDITGKTVVLPLRARPLLVAFTSTNCPLCAQLREALLVFAGSHPEVPVAVFCEGRPRAVQAWAGDLPQKMHVIADRRGQVAVGNGVDGTPFCIAVGSDGTVRAKGVVNDLEALELFADEARSLPMIETVHPTSEAEVTR